MGQVLTNSYKTDTRFDGITTSKGDKMGSGWVAFMLHRNAQKEDNLLLNLLHLKKHQELTRHQH